VIKPLIIDWNEKALGNFVETKTAGW